jgi:predicted Fe-S protein YdhL (DUF1289 family)
MHRQHPILSLRAVREHFDKSDEPLLLSKFEFTAILEEVEPAMATGSEVSALKREIARIRKVAAPTWKACKRVSRLVSKCGCTARSDKIPEWQFYLDQARVVHWRDLPERLRSRWRDFTGL